MSGCPVHKFLRHLRQFAGLPVPPAIKWMDGKPDFRQVDQQKWMDAIETRRCGVCGKPLGDNAYWIGGDGCFNSKCFLDLAMHRQCAEASFELCPFLNGTRAHYRGVLNPHPQQDVTARPATLYLMRGVTDEMELARLSDSPDHLVIFAGRSLTKVATYTTKETNP